MVLIICWGDDCFMKAKSLFRLIILASCLLSCFCSFPKTNLDKNKTDSFDINSEYLSLNITVFDKEPDKLAVECFDVNRFGLIVIGTADGQYKNISVYNDSGVFQYGFRLTFNGSFGLRWCGDSIQLLLVRRDLIITIEYDGSISEIIEIKEDNTEYWENEVYKPERNIEGIKYILKNKMGFFNILASNYSQLVVIDSENEHIIYDVNCSQLAKAWIRLIYWGAFLAIALFIIIKTNKSKWKTKKEGR